MTFKEFVSKRKVSFDARGDFIVEARADSSFAEVGSWPALEAPFEKSHDLGAMQAARDVWPFYIDETRKERGVKPT